jgi:hypothetical protein
LALPNVKRNPAVGVRTYEARGVLAGAYRGKAPTYLTHWYDVTDGTWGPEKTLCRRITDDHLSDLPEAEPATCPECTRRFAVLSGKGLAVASGHGIARETKGNPAAVLRVAAPVGELVELGVLTRLDALYWSLRDAPVLAYDKAGRLFIVYAGKVSRSSTIVERREYARTHWGAEGRGDARDGVIAAAPLVAFGESSVIQYTTRKGGDRELVDYVHEWGEGSRAKLVRPTIVAHDCGKPSCRWHGALALLGGSYTVEERGIVG